MNKKRVGRQHPDYNQRPDSGVIWLDELVKDADYPDRISLLPFDATTLWRTIAEGRFPKPVIGRRGWRLGEVREWMRRRDALELPPPDSGQSTTKLFSAAPLSTRGSTTDAVRRVRKPGATLVTEGRDATALEVHDHRQVDAGGEAALAQVESSPPTDAAQTESDGEPCDVRLLLRSIFAGVAHE